MDRQDQHEDFPETSTHGIPRQKAYVRPHTGETRNETSAGFEASSTLEIGEQPAPVDAASFAYQLLLLQQRLVAYEQLHLEEIAELRQEIEQLRRTFLQETSPQLRAISPIRHKYTSDESI